MTICMNPMGMKPTQTVLQKIWKSRDSYPPNFITHASIKVSMEIILQKMSHVSTNPWKRFSHQQILGSLKYPMFLGKTVQYQGLGVPGVVHHWLILQVLDVRSENWKHEISGFLLKTIRYQQTNVCKWQVLWLRNQLQYVVLVIDCIGSGDSWMYPYQRTPMVNPYIRPIYSGYLWVIIYNPQESEGWTQ